MSREPKILLFIPGYNCEKQVVRVLKKITPKISKYFSEIIFVNNRSTDKTEQAVLDFCEKISIPLKVLRNNDNYNLGGSHKVAFTYAIRNKFDYIVVLHGDDQGDIHDIIPILKSKEYLSHDCMLGSRFMHGSKLIGYSRFRTFGNRIYNLLFSIVVKKQITDLGSGLNMYSVKMLKTNFFHKFPDKLTFNYCMILAAHYYGHDLKFFPISWREEDQKSNVKMASQAISVLGLLIKYAFCHKIISGEMRDIAIGEYGCKEIH